MTTTTTVSTFVTPIQFSKEIGKNPQQVYQWIRENKIPEECLVQDTISGKKVFVREQIETWYQNRPTRSGSTNNTVRLTQDPTMILEMMVGWFKESGHEELSGDLEKVLLKLKQPE